MTTPSRRRSALPAVTAILVVAAGLGPGPAGGGGPAEAAPVGAATVKPRVADTAVARERATGQARRTGHKVAIDELTTETTRVWAKPDGTYESVIASGPVRAKRDGRWAEVDLTLRQRADGMVTPGVHLKDLVLSGAKSFPSEHDLVSIAAGKSRRSMRWSGRLPAPVLAGNRATYPDVYPGIDLVVEAQMTGYEQYTVVKSRAALAHVEVSQAALKLGDGRSRPDGAGGLVHGSSADAGVTPTPLMWDAAVDRRTGLPQHVHKVGVTPRGGGFVLAADTAWLRDPARQFPITIDPSDTQNAWNGEDTWVKSGTSSTFWYSTELELGTQNSGGTKRIAYVNFTGAGMAGATIHYANLKLWGTHVASGGSCADSQWQIFLASSNADINTNWSRRPYLIDGNNIETGYQDGNGSLGDYRFTAAGGALASSPCTGGWVNSDARGLFQNVADRRWGVFTAALTPLWDHTNVFYKRFKSYNSETYPHAVVSYSFPPTLTSRGSDPTTPCVEGAARPVITTARPTLSATFAQSDGYDVEVHFEYGEIGAATTVRTRTVGQGHAAAHQIPAGELADGKHYRWKVSAKSSAGVWSAADDSTWCEFTVDTWAPKVSGCPGTATANADFNGDGNPETVIADPLAAVSGTWEAGVVHVVDGGTGARTTLDQNLAEVPDSVESGDRFGSAFSVVDLNVDGCADLAVSAPYEDLTVTDAGLVVVLYGTPTGLGKGPAAESFATGVGRMPGTQGAWDTFGYALFGGQTGAGEPFLLVGTPGDDIGAESDAGSVTYIRGQYRITFDQSTSAGSAAETDDRGGYALAATAHHFAVSYPGESKGPGTEYGGEVCVFTHAFTNDKPGAVGCRNQDSGGVADTVEAGDTFGKSISLAPYRAAGQPAGTDSVLAVGAPGEDLDSTPDAGMVQQFRVSGTSVTELATVTQDTTGVSGSNETGDLFGEQVRVVNTNPAAEVSATTLLLAVGSPGENAGTTVDAGVVRVFAAGTPTIGVDATVERGSGPPGSLLARELVGISLGGTATELLIAAPYLTQKGVYGIRWEHLAAGAETVSRSWTPASLSLTSTWAFGAQVG